MLQKQTTDLEVSSKISEQQKLSRLRIERRSDSRLVSPQM
jgi:hypothetical protein